MRGSHSSELCLAIAVKKVDIDALKDVVQREANSTVIFDEENRELECGLLDVSANVHFISWDPSLLRDNCALRGPDVEVQWYPRVLGRDPWRLWHIVLSDIPGSAMVYYIVELKKIRSSEQVREVSRDALGREGICNKSVHKDVVNGRLDWWLDASVHVERGWMNRVMTGRTC